jgi:hypothetical protein
VQDLLGRGRRIVIEPVDRRPAAVGERAADERGAALVLDGQGGQEWYWTARVARSAGGVSG